MLDNLEAYWQLAMAANANTNDGVVEEEDDDGQGRGEGGMGAGLSADMGAWIWRHLDEGTLDDVKVVGLPFMGKKVVVEDTNSAEDAEVRGVGVGIGGGGGAIESSNRNRRERTRRLGWQHE